MNLNENDAMERNDVLYETNNLICYMPKMELRMRSYDMMKLQEKYKGEGESQP